MYRRTQVQVCTYEEGAPFLQQQVKHCREAALFALEHMAFRLKIDDDKASSGMDDRRPPVESTVQAFTGSLSAG
jgi:hypothetical protein